eukprot:CAMPEP_0177673094 /NCGR_PEP_ID=MMETSP0447-20121125/25732_1 /TAXON_ID=0 /ORGANISM="Stygamoeba regulata, Strain BSH-02190019" /LENGTH=750 /DNA_ID=CAMNT_0019180887 /DNA_START=62 /DNA_END=2310 /DNA_ORIENTATION=+
MPRLSILRHPVVWYGWPLLVLCLCLSGWLHLRLSLAQDRCELAHSPIHPHLKRDFAQLLSQSATEAPFVDCPPDAGTLSADERRCVLALAQQRAAQQLMTNAQALEVARNQPVPTRRTNKPPQNRRIRTSFAQRSRESSATTPTSEQERKKSNAEILVWHGASVLEGLWRWGDAPGQEHPLPNHLGTTIVQPDCPVRCDWTWDRTALSTADVVLFDPCHYGTKEFERYAPELPEKRAHQSWWYYSYEQPHYFTLQQKKEYMRHFEENITYDQNGLVPVTLMCPWGGYTDWLRPPPPKDPEHMVAFMASNCGGDTLGGGAVSRKHYVEELMHHIDVHSYGKCLHNKDFDGEDGHGGWEGSFGDMMRRKQDLIGRYHFFLVFENNNQVDDYVTEKLANALLAGTLPVYYGTRTVDRWIPAANSIIRVDDFISPRHLAEHLRRVAADPDLYASYFEWKQRPLSAQFEKIISRCIFYAGCRICEEATKRREYVDRMLGNEIRANVAGSHALLLNSVGGKLTDADDFVEIPHSDVLDLNDHFTIMAWVQTHLPFGGILDKNRAYSLDGYHLDIHCCRSDQICLRFCGGSGCFESRRSLKRGTWYHVAVSFSVYGGVRLYVNGKLDSVHYSREEVASNELPLRFGKPAKPRKGWRSTFEEGLFRGMLDSISIWDAVLSADRIQELAFRRLSGSEQDLIGCWGFDDGGGPRVVDLGPHMLHGAIFGAPIFVESHTKPLSDLALASSAADRADDVWST